MVPALFYFNDTIIQAINQSVFAIDSKQSDNPAGIDDLITPVAIIAVIKIYIDVVLKIMLFYKPAVPALLIQYFPEGIEIPAAVAAADILGIQYPDHFLHSISFLISLIN